MRTIILSAVLVSLVGGLVGAFAYGQLFGEASAALLAQRVREQNLDANGLIRVHEQGTANVTVTNASLPVSGTVDVGNLPLDANGNLKTAPQSGSGKFYLLLDDVTINPGQVVWSSFANVDGCRAFNVFVGDTGQIGGIPDITASLVLSPDGSEPYVTVPVTTTSSGGGAALGHTNALFQFLPLQFTQDPRLEPFAPFAAVTLFSASSTQHVVDVSLYCLP
ncbi:MAG TPA: hypothetical protein VFT91_10130 [Dehalococcoidia bacterium]|nr:hypothetical protein [Dehalococcoidia bacterium]